MYRSFLVFPISMIVLALSGCAPQTTPVSGKVTLAGKGLENMNVLFQPVAVEGREAATGMTDGQGRFVLKRVFSNKNGVEPGEYRVFVSWQDTEPYSEFDKGPRRTPPCKVPSSLGDGSVTRHVETKGAQTIEFELNDYPDVKVVPLP